jgi:hypothetical protein
MRERERARARARARARVRSLLTINKNLKVGKYNALSGNTASVSDRDCNAEVAARRGGSKCRNYSTNDFLLKWYRYRTSQQARIHNGSLAVKKREYYSIKALVDNMQHVKHEALRRSWGRALNDNGTAAMFMFGTKHSGIVTFVVVISYCKNLCTSTLKS